MKSCFYFSTLQKINDMTRTMWYFIKLCFVFFLRLLGCIRLWNITCFRLMSDGCKNFSTFDWLLTEIKAWDVYFIKNWDVFDAVVLTFSVLSVWYKMGCLLLSNFLMDFFGIYVVIKSNFCTFGCILVNNYGFYFTFPNFCRSFQANLHC